MLYLLLFFFKEHSHLYFHFIPKKTLWPTYSKYHCWKMILRNSPGQNTGVSSLSLLQGIFPTQGSNTGLPHCKQTLYQLSYKGNSSIIIAAAAAKSLQSCPTLCDPIDGSPPGTFIPGIIHARILEWAAISFYACMHAKLL